MRRRTLLAGAAGASLTAVSNRASAQSATKMTIATGVDPAFSQFYVAKEGGLFEKNGLDVKPTELIARGAAIPEIGISEAIDAAAFALPQGGVSDAIVTPTGTAIIRVAEKVSVTDAEVEAGKAELRDELVNTRRDKFFNAYMDKAKKALKISTHDDVLARVIGS